MNLFQLFISFDSFVKVVRFIEWQALVLSPICPHVSDYIWTEWLKNKTSILRAKWPVVGNVDESGGYFFRYRYFNLFNYFGWNCCLKFTKDIFSTFLKDRIDHNCFCCIST